MSVKSPFFPQNISQKTPASTTRLPVCAIVSTHHRLHTGFLHTCLKCRKISFPQILFIHACIEAVTHILRTAVHRKMLGTRCCLEILLIMPLQSHNIAHAKPAGQIGVLAKRLMSPSPARVAENIDIGRPERQSLINVFIVPLLLHDKLCPRLCGDRIAHLLHQLLVKRCRHADRLRENGRCARARHAVQRLIPPVVRLDAKPLDRR